jgi:hypothetical protein
MHYFKRGKSAAGNNYAVKAATQFDATLFASRKTG